MYIELRVLPCRTFSGAGGTLRNGITFKSVNAQQKLPYPSFANYMTWKTRVNLRGQFLREQSFSDFVSPGISLLILDVNRDYEECSE